MNWIYIDLYDLAKSFGDVLSEFLRNQMSSRHTKSKYLSEKICSCGKHKICKMGDSGHLFVHVPYN